MLVLGVDLLAGSPNARTQPRYSVAVLENGRFVLREEVTRSRLLRLIRELRPDRIAVDNVLELFPKKKMRSFFYLLPPGTQLVQVTGPHGSAKPLHVVAKSYGVKVGRSSMEEAEACAMLAAMNVGCTVELFENRTRIIVSRARSMTRGGQSKDRYRRKVHAMVGLCIRDIKERLREQNHRFVLRTVRADSGYSRGEFLVYAPRSELWGIKSRRGSDVQIKVIPVERNALKYTPLGTENRSVIMGIDPGTTTAVAVVSLDGELLEVTSSKNMSLQECLMIAARYRDVVVVASDVSPAPRLVERVASKLNAVLFIPPATMSVEEKNRLVDTRLGRHTYRNAHERDAIAAALKAYNMAKPKLDNIDRRLGRMNAMHLREELRKAVLRGESLHRALERSLDEEVQEEEKSCEVEQVPDEHREVIRALKRDVEMLRRVLREKEEAIRRRDEVIEELRIELRELRDEERRRARVHEEVRRREQAIVELTKKLEEARREIYRLKRRIEELEAERRAEGSPDRVVVRILPKLSREAVGRAGERLRGEVVLIEDASGAGRAAAEELRALEPVAVIADLEQMPHMAREVLREVVVVHPEQVELKRYRSFAVADRRELEEAIERRRREMREEAAARAGEMLESMLREYRSERMTGV